MMQRDPVPQTNEQTYRMVYHDEAIGTSRLEGRDVDMAVAFGTFEPVPAYEVVRGIFLLFTDAHDEQGHLADKAKLARYYQTRDALRLTLETSQGRTISTNWIHIADWGDLGCEISVQITDPAFWAIQ